MTLAVTPEDAEFLELRRFSEEEIMKATGFTCTGDEPRFTEAEFKGQGLGRMPGAPYGAAIRFKPGITLALAFDVLHELNRMGILEGVASHDVRSYDDRFQLHLAAQGCTGCSPLTSARPGRQKSPENSTIK